MTGEPVVLSRFGWLIVAVLGSLIVYWLLKIRHLILRVTPQVEDCYALGPGRVTDLSRIVRIGGVPETAAGEEWPRCEGCQQRLEFVFQAELHDDLPARPAGVGVISVYFCWTCLPLRGRADVDGQACRVRCLVPGQPRSPAGVPADLITNLMPLRWRSVTKPYLPEWDGGAADERLARLWEAARQVLVPGSYIGGKAPGWLGDDLERICVHCQAPLKFFLKLDSEPHAQMYWGQGASLFLFYCPTHPDHWRFAIRSRADS